MNEQIAKLIVEYLKKKPHGATIKEITEELGINRMTALRYLEILRTQGLVDYEEDKRTKIWYLVGETSLLEVFKSEKPYIKHLKYKEGNVVLLEDLLMIIIPASFFSNIYELYGEEAPRKMYQLGYEFGKTLAYLYEINTGVRVSGIGLLLSTLKNLVNFLLRGGFGKLEEIKEDKKYITIRIKESIFPKIISTKKGKTCNFIAGYIAGITEVLTGKKLPVYETKCASEGFAYCEFVIHKE